MNTIYLKKQDKDQLLRHANELEKILTSLKGKHREVFSEFLPSLQGEVIRLGENLEQTGLAVEQEVRILEQVCEELYVLSTESERESEMFGALERDLADVRNGILSYPAKKLILFLPYKASMWDSLESVYLACKGYENMECRVMPIPYFSKSEEGTGLTMHIDEGFPADIPITDCRSYDLSLAEPDAILIHNPYDNANYVTSVHPMFYSDELKKHTPCLIYIPYYTENHGLSFPQSNLPVYRNMDWFISPSEAHKESTRELYFYEKVVALGSPKLDKAVRLSKNAPGFPASWGSVPEGKKRILLDTTVNYVLNDANEPLSTLRSIFDRIRETEDVILVWRPHPLLSDTYRSLRPEDYPKLQELKKYFSEERIGIYDETGDAALALSLCDAELDSGSSMAVLAAASEKPVFRIPYGKWDMALLDGFLESIRRGELEETVREEKEKLSEFAGPCDGRSGERIAEWLNKILNGI